MCSYFVGKCKGKLPVLTTFGFKVVLAIETFNCSKTPGFLNIDLLCSTKMVPQKECSLHVLRVLLRWCTEQTMSGGGVASMDPFRNDER